MLLLMGNPLKGSSNPTERITTMATPISDARETFQRHGMTIHGNRGRYVIRRDIPPYGLRCPESKRFHRDWKGFHASDVPLTWVRRLADALTDAEQSRATACDCAEAWAGLRRAETKRDEALSDCRWIARDRSDFTLQESADATRAAETAQGVVKVARMCQEILLEDWQIWHFVSETVAAIDRGRQLQETATAAS